MGRSGANPASGCESCRIIVVRFIWRGGIGARRSTLFSRRRQTCGADCRSCRSSPRRQNPRCTSILTPSDCLWSMARICGSPPSPPPMVCLTLESSILFRTTRDSYGLAGRTGSIGTMVTDSRCLCTIPGNRTALGTIHLRAVQRQVGNALGGNQQVPRQARSCDRKVHALSGGA